VKAWQGVDPAEAGETRTYHFGRGANRRNVEALHNAALEAGFESEIVYYDAGYDLRVRRPADDVHPSHRSHLGS
jgi:hypothetical protein